VKRGSSSANVLKPGQAQCGEIDDMQRLFDMSLGVKYTIVVKRYVWRTSKREPPLKAVSNKLDIILVDQDQPLDRKLPSR
jgi:hypothetical protein